MRRHYTNYLKGLPNIKEFRQRLVTLKGLEEIEDVLADLAKAYEGHVFETRRTALADSSYTCG
jgi:tRNA-dihydrouridine synthase